MKLQKFFMESQNLLIMQSKLRKTLYKGGLGADLPEIKIRLNEIKKGINILDLIANYKILSSKSEARRVILNKGFKINGILIEDDKKVLNLRDFKINALNYRMGKKNII